jgi:hypothetical protein
MNWPAIAAAMEPETPLVVGMRSTADKLASAIKATGAKALIVPKDQMYSVWKMPERTK